MSARRNAALLTVMTALSLTAATVTALPSARAANTVLCTGYAACNAAGYTSHGYNDTTNQTMYWRSYAGHNCTNYAAYVESTVFGVGNPPGLMGNAVDWAANAAAYGMGSVDTNPTVGSVAWWNGTAGMGSSGHVAIVEAVGSGSVTVSEDNWGGDFHWRTYATSGISGFIHFTGQRAAAVPSPTPTPTPVPAPSPSPAPAPPTVTSFAPSPVDLYALHANGTASGNGELTVVPAGLGYGRTTAPIATALGPTSTTDWTFLISPYAGDNQPDLWAIRLRGGASGRVEVHVLSAVSGYRNFLAHIATALPSIPTGFDPQVQLASYAGDGQPDLFLVLDHNTGSGRVEVHVLSAASGYQTFSAHIATALGEPAAGQTWQYLVGDARGWGNLVAVLTGGSSGSGRTEVHVLTQASYYQAFASHAATPFSLGLNGSWSLGWAGAGAAPNLYLLLRVGSRQTVELHALTGSSGYGQISTQVATSLPAVSAAGWELALG